jgi:hypothetical protein
MKANLKLKDSVFSAFFTDKAKAIELYNGATNSNVLADATVEFNTLDDVIYKDRINDLSFILNGKLIVLLEHQSTINENMALRMLLYVGRLYDRMFQKDKSVYKRKRVSIPTPQFIVFYNGKEPIAEHQVINLSDSFAQKDVPFPLELYVDVYDIKYSEEHMPEILKKCPSLKEYSFFIHNVDENKNSGQELDIAIKHGIQYCIEHDIMKEFLEKHGSEVHNMLFTEWNQEDFYKVGREEAIADYIESRVRLWKDKMSVDEISELLSISPAEVEAIIKKLQ